MRNELFRARTIDHRYAAQAAARNEWRAETDALKTQLSLVQATVAQLQAVIDKARAKQKLRNMPTPSTPAQP